MLERNKLKQIFTKAAVSGVVALCLAGDVMRGAGVAPPELTEVEVNGCDPANHTPEKAMPLTKGEVAFVRSIFGNAVDTSVERKYLLGPLKGMKSPALTCAEDNAKNIEFHGTAQHSNDYSQAALVNYGYFIHEMTHVWQFQNRRQVEWCLIYKYSLDSKHSYADYCIEQQATIIEDYARHFLHPGGGSTSWNEGNDFGLLAKVVEEQFPEAQKTRLALAAKNSPRPDS